MARRRAGGAIRRPTRPSSGAPPRPPRPRVGLKRFLSLRRGIQAAVGAGIWLAVVYGRVGLLEVILVGSALGILLGKFFCRWMCPMGALVELVLGAGDPDGKQQALYNYFKIGCPIAWVGGWLNRVSLGRVKIDLDRCTHCSRCDGACYVARLAPERSLHVEGSANASLHSSCSRCLACVSACPTGALTYGLALGGGAVVRLPEGRDRPGRDRRPAA